jgi:hypothetical protein
VKKRGIIRFIPSRIVHGKENFGLRCDLDAALMTCACES